MGILKQESSNHWLPLIFRHVSDKDFVYTQFLNILIEHYIVENIDDYKNQSICKMWAISIMADTRNHPDQNITLENISNHFDKWNTI